MNERRGERRGVDSIRERRHVFRCQLSFRDVRSTRPRVYGEWRGKAGLSKRLSRRRRRCAAVQRNSNAVPFRAFPSRTVRPSGPSGFQGFLGLPRMCCSFLCTITSDCALLLSWHKGGAVSFINSRKNPESLNVYPRSKAETRSE